MADPCHDPSVGSYETCIRNGFDMSGVAGIPDTGDFHYFFAGIAGLIVLVAAAWMLSEIYNSWATKRLPTKYLINTPIRVIFITTITMYLIFNTG